MINAVYLTDCLIIRVYVTALMPSLPNDKCNIHCNISFSLLSLFQLPIVRHLVRLLLTGRIVHVKTVQYAYH